MTEASIRHKVRAICSYTFRCVVGTSTTIWGGEGAWKITEIRNDGVSGNKYFWDQI